MRIGLPPKLKEQWDAVLESRGISQQRAVVALLGWIVEQDPLVQLMVFGQAPEQDKGALARMVLDRLAAPAAKGKGAKRAG